MAITEERLAILEQFSSTDIQDLCAEIRRLRIAVDEAFQQGYNIGRIEGGEG